MSIRKLSFRLRWGTMNSSPAPRKNPMRIPPPIPRTPPQKAILSSSWLTTSPMRSPATAPETANVTVDRIRLRRIAFIRPGESMGRVLSPNHMMGCLFLRMKSPSNRLLTTMFPLLK